MKLRTCLSLILCLALLGFSALSEAASAPGDLPIATEPVTLTAWVIQGSIVEDLFTNKTTAWAEEQTGVHIEWIPVNAEEAKTLLNLSLASGEYPDMYLYRFPSTDIVQMYGGYDVFIPLNDLIEEYGVNTKQVFEDHPEYRDYFTAPDGNIYTSIYTDPGEHLLSQNKLFVITEWLEAVGMDIPTTTEAFKEMLIAFRDQDVNGNGDTTDEIPLMGALKDTNEPVGFLMNPFQLYTGDYILAQDGQVTFSANTDGWRDGLRYIADLYAENLLAEETFVQDATQLKTLVSIAEPTERIVGAFSGMWQGVAVNTGVIENGYDLYAPVTPLEGPTGLRQTATTGFGTVSMHGAITSACEHPEIAFRWLDFWLSEEATVVVDYGFEGSEYEWSDTPAINGTVPGRQRTNTDKWSTVQNDIYDLSVVPHYRTSDILYSRTPTDHVPYLYAAAQAYEPFYVLTGFPAFIWASDADLINETSELETLIRDYVKTSYTQFILGILDINDDAAWQSYLDTLNGMGLERYLELKQQIVFGE